MSMAKVRFSCPRCGRSFESSEIGVKFECSCGQRLQIPAPPPMKTVLGVIEPPPQAILPQAIVIEPPPVPVQEQLPSRSKKRFECPFCHSHEPPEYRNEMTTVGWLL